MNHHECRLLDPYPEQCRSHRGRPVLKALETWHPGYLELVGRTWSGRLSASRWFICAPRFWSIRRAGPSSIRADADIAGACSGAGGRGRKVNSASICGEPAWQEVAGRAPRAASPPDRDPGRYRAASVEQQRHLEDCALALRHAQPVPGQCRGRPSPVGDGLSPAQIFRPRWPRRSRRSGGALSFRFGGGARTLGAFNEATLDWLSFSHVDFFTDRRREDAAGKPLRNRLRPAVTDLSLQRLTEEAITCSSARPDRAHGAATREAMKEAGIEDPNEIEKVRKLGVIDLADDREKLHLHHRCRSTCSAARSDQRGER